MPQIGWLEIFVIVSIAIIVVGPKDFPLMLKKMGSWIGSIKRYVSDVQTQVSEIADENIDNENKNNNSIKKENNIKGKSFGPTTIIAIETIIKISNQPICGICYSLLFES